MERRRQAGESPAVVSFPMLPLEAGGVGVSTCTLGMFLRASSAIFFRPLVKSFYRKSAEQASSTPGKSLLATLAGYSCRPRRSESQLNYRCPDLQKGQRSMGSRAKGFSLWLFPPVEPPPQSPPYWDVVRHRPERVSASLCRQARRR